MDPRIMKINVFHCHWYNYEKCWQLFNFIITPFSVLIVYCIKELVEMLVHIIIEKKTTYTQMQQARNIIKRKGKWKQSQSQTIQKSFLFDKPHKHFL